MKLDPALGPRPDFPLCWDNTMRTSFISCPQKWAWEFLYHYKPTLPSVHLHAGQAWAKGLEVTRTAYYCEGKDPEDALSMGIQAMFKAYGTFECPPHIAKDPGRLAEAMVYYFTKYPLATDDCKPYIGKNGPMIEFSFALPLDIDLRHPITGEPIIYTGRTDMIAIMGNSAISVFDDKTTSQLGASWAQQWDMRSQFTGYVWACREYGIPVKQVVARGIALLKEKFNTSQAISFRPEFRLDRWREQVVRDIRRAITSWEEGYFDTNEADECSSYGGCMFKSPCQAVEPEPWLRVNFAKRIWDPLARTETEVRPE